MRREFTRALAYIAKIHEIKPIPNYDRVEHARINGWWVVVKKGEFQVGDMTSPTTILRSLAILARRRSALMRYKNSS